jgi:hypothetical protein
MPGKRKGGSRILPPLRIPFRVIPGRAQREPGILGFPDAQLRI